LSPSSWLIEIDDYYLQSSVSYYDLNRKVTSYSRAAEVVKGYSFDLSGASQSQISRLAVATARLYGLLHARFCVTEEGASKLSQKVAMGTYGTCPRVSCKGARLLPVGLTAEPDRDKVKLYCLKCHDVYNSQSDLDAAYFGPDIPIMYCKVLQLPLRFQVYSRLLEKYRDDTDKQVPAIKQRLFRWGEIHFVAHMSDK
jgi:casein kinase II subunit beta